jgi:hypothetical protein
MTGKEFLFMTLLRSPSSLSRYSGERAGERGEVLA